MNIESLSVTPLSTALGVEVEGLNLADVTKDDVKVVLELLNRHKVLFFPAQQPKCR